MKRKALVAALLVLAVAGVVWAEGSVFNSPFGGGTGAVVKADCAPYIALGQICQDSGTGAYCGGNGTACVTIIGSQGPQGIQGTQGIQGIQGPAGPAGAGSLGGTGVVVLNETACWQNATTMKSCGQANPAQDLRNTANPSFSTLNAYGTGIAVGTPSSGGSPATGKIQMKNAATTFIFTRQPGATSQDWNATEATAPPAGNNYLVNRDMDGTEGYTDPATFADTNGWDDTVRSAEPTGADLAAHRIFRANNEVGGWRPLSDMNGTTTDYFVMPTSAGWVGVVDINGNILLSRVLGSTTPYSSDWNGSQNATSQGVVYDQMELRLPKSTKWSQCTTIKDPVATSDHQVYRAPQAIHITNAHVMAVGGTSLTGQFQRCDTARANCANISADMVGTAATNVNDNGTISLSAVTAGQYVIWNTTSVSGTQTEVMPCFDYTVD